MLNWTKEVRIISREGYLVIPAFTRRLLNIEKGDTLAFYVDENKIILKRYNPSHGGCGFCGNVEDLINIKNKQVCQNCLQIIKKN